MQRNSPSGTNSRWKAIALAAVFAACGQGVAANGTMQVQVRVLAAQPATALLDAFPAPAGSARLSRTRLADSYACPLAQDEAARAVQAAMAARGYRLEFASNDGSTQRWRDAHGRIAVRLDPVLGTTPSTRIVVEADALS